MSVNLEIYNALKALSENGSELRMVNSYHGLPVEYDAIIKEMGQEYAILAVHPYQAVCLAIEQYTHLVSPNLPFVLRADVQNVDYESDKVRLANFLFAPNTIGLRSSPRVEPAHKVQVTVSNRKSSSRGELLDISEVGAGVCAFSALLYNPVTMKRGATISLKVDLDEFSPTLEVNGEILYNVKDGDIHRMGIKIDPDEHSRNVINQFVSQRKVVLLGELQALAEARHSVPNTDE